MKFQRTLKEEVSVNLTPLIDVVFLLLIFFMVTTTFTRDSNLLINLPEAKGLMSQEVPLQVEVMIARNGAYTVNGQSLVNTNIETLIDAITQINAGDVDMPIVITGDAEASYQSVVTAMDAVSRLGLTRINLATREAGAEQP